MNCHTSNQKGTSIMQHAGNCMVKAKAEMVIKSMFSLSARSQTRQNTVTDIPSQQNLRSCRQLRQEHSVSRRCD